MLFSGSYPVWVVEQVINPFKHILKFEFNTVK